MLTGCWVDVEFPSLRPLCPRSHLANYIYKPGNKDFLRGEVQRMKPAWFTYQLDNYRGTTRWGTEEVRESGIHSYIVIACSFSF